MAADKFSAGEAVMTFSADDKPFQATANQVVESMKRVSSTMDEGAKAAQGFIVNVREFTILNQVSGAAHKLGDAFQKMSADFQQGKVSAAEFALEIAKDTPIVGNFITLGRGIHELITGEQAYTEILKQQTAEQEKRLEVMKSVDGFIKQTSRKAEDIRSQLDFHVGDSEFVHNFQTLFTKGVRDAQDAKEQIKGQEDILKQIAEQRETAAENLKRAIAANVVHITPTGPGGTAGIIPAATDSADVVKARQALASLDDQARKVRESVGELHRAYDELIPRAFDTAAVKLIGNEIVKGFDAGRAAVERFIGVMPKLNADTTTAIASMVTPVTEFQNKIANFRTDLLKGSISNEVFQALSFKAFANEGINALAPLIQRLKVAAEIKFHFADSLLGAPVERFGGGLVKAFQELANLPFGKAKPKDFTSSFVGLGDLNTRIQQAAGSLTGDEQLEIAKKQLEATKENSRAGFKVAENTTGLLTYAKTRRGAVTK